MCDCFTAHCHGYACHGRLEIHCADFCMKREDYITYCGDCVPDKDVVIYETLTKCPVDEVPAGQILGIRYRRYPPKGYGMTAVTPNTGAEWVARKIDGKGQERWFTSVSNRMFGTRARAMAYAKSLHPGWPKSR